jgi:hypothetical protein
MGKYSQKIDKRKIMAASGNCSVRYPADLLHATIQEHKGCSEFALKAPIRFSEHSVYMKRPMQQTRKKGYSHYGVTL